MTNEAKPEKIGPGWFIAGALMSLFSVQDFVTGELSMWGGNLFLVGTHARCTSLLWFVFMLCGPYLYLRRNVFPHHRLAGILLSSGVAAGVGATAIASVYLNRQASLAVGAATMLLAVIPGFLARQIQPHYQSGKQDD